MQIGSRGKQRKNRFPGGSLWGVWTSCLFHQVMLLCCSETQGPLVSVGSFRNECENNREMPRSKPRKLGDWMHLKLIPGCKPAESWTLCVRQGSLSHPRVMIRRTHTQCDCPHLGNVGLFHSAPASGDCPQTRSESGAECASWAASCCLPG